MMIQGPFYSFRDAAAYCGYHPETLARILREEGIDLPRSGPRNNRYAKSVVLKKERARGVNRKPLNFLVELEGIEPTTSFFPPS
jgi:hypothetical protein